MAKETLKDKITRLEKDIKGYKLQINEYKALVESLNQEISDMIDNKDEEFQGSATYKQMNKRIKFLELENKSLKDTIDHEKKIHKLINENNHNNRGAGRKSKFTEGDRETMRMYRFQGKTIKEIAEIYGCSVGLVHKLVKE